MVKTIFVDFDGTLIDTLSLTIECGHIILKDKADKITASALRDKELTKYIKEDLGLSTLELLSIVNKIKKYIHDRIDSVNTIRGVPQALRTLSKKYRIVILSSNSEKTIRYILDKNKIDFIDTIISDSSLFGKATVINRSLKKLKIDKKDALYLGDETRDVYACQKAGIKIIAVSWGYNSRALLKTSKPDYIIDTPKELVELLM